MKYNILRKKLIIMLKEMLHKCRILWAAVQVKVNDDLRFIFKFFYRKAGISQLQSSSGSHYHSVCVKKFTSCNILLASLACEASSIMYQVLNRKMIVPAGCERHGLIYSYGKWADFNVSPLLIHIFSAFRVWRLFPAHVSVGETAWRRLRIMIRKPRKWVYPVSLRIDRPDYHFRHKEG